MKRVFLALFVAIPALVWGVWLLAVPEGMVADRVAGAFRGMGLEAEMVGFRKGLFFNIEAEALDISRAGRRLVSVEDLSARLDLPSLLILRAAVPFEGRAAGGALRGRATLRKGGHSLSMDISDADLGETALLEMAGLSGSGRLSGELALEGGAGTLRFSASALKLEPATLMDVQAPLNMFESARGIVRIRGGTVELESVSLEGKGIYARVQGSATGGSFDGKLEIMPDLSVVPDEFLASAMGRYRVSRGHYSIPIKERLEF